ncbi:DUF2809 domain-containing protein [Pedobacter sp. MC2016-24]|uniref:ribosomal maturation YjgA family protein n=1 Tax=Pedobacter sp. MC2016-24 TaxID=2780090 RepID=UPI00187F5227|nr:DUF2809 domain-containing protein [Pedobacter sp. MC2016-24]MBE9602265.1 DUF2809 domain-containing protein [Pedobacter sp. MC2016-24]
MQFRKRLPYVGLIFLIILLGLLSRQFALIPVSTGDALWATMIFFIVRFFLVDARVNSVAWIGLLICYLVEFSQLYQQPWINNIRQTLPGRLILGQGFLWSDLIAYAIGIFIAYLIDSAVAGKRSLTKGSK